MDQVEHQVVRMLKRKGSDDSEWSAMKAAAAKLYLDEAADEAKSRKLIRGMVASGEVAADVGDTQEREDLDLVLDHDDLVKLIAQI